MTFQEFLSITNYKPATVARSVLYEKDKRPSKMAERMGFVPTEEEKTKLRYLIAGKKTFEQLFENES